MGIEALRTLRKYDDAFISLDSFEVNTFEIGFLSQYIKTTIVAKGFVHEK